MKNYRELTMTKPRSVADAQAARKIANAALPAIDWDLKREALISSGLVAERKQ